MKTNEIDPGEGFRLLWKGEVVQPGDEYFLPGNLTEEPGWFPSKETGKTVLQCGLPMRRALPRVVAENGKVVAFDTLTESAILVLSYRIKLLAGRDFGEMTTTERLTYLVQLGRFVEDRLDAFEKTTREGLEGI